jgi:hypothetical protein
VEFDFNCKFMFVTGKIKFYAAAIILLINVNEGGRFNIYAISVSFEKKNYFLINIKQEMKKYSRQYDKSPFAQIFTWTPDM